MTIRVGSETVPGFTPGLVVDEVDWWVSPLGWAGVGIVHHDC